MGQWLGGCVRGIVRLGRGCLRVMFGISRFILVAVIVGLLVGLFQLVRLSSRRARPSNTHTRNNQHSDSTVNLTQCDQCGAWVSGACEACGSNP